MAEQQERARLATLSFSAAVLLLSYSVYLLFKPFLIPLCWAGVLVVCCYPWHARLARRLGPNLAATTSTLAVALLVIGPAVAIGMAFVSEAAAAIDVVNAALTEERFAQLQAGWQWLQTQIPGQQPGDLKELVTQTGTRMAAIVAREASGLVRNAFVFLFDLIVMLFATYFLFRDAGRVVEGLRRVLPFNRARTDAVLMQARDLIQAGVTAGLAVASLQGAIGGLTMALLGFTAPVFWGVVMALLSLLPLVGSALVWGPAAIYLLVTGSVVKGLILAGIGAGVVSMVDNVVRPILLSERAQMNGLLVFISLLGGASAFGLLGIVLGPIIVATALTLLAAYTNPGGVDDSGVNDGNATGAEVRRAGEGHPDEP
jgi:predicted PurR-regulated permease PerM